MLARLLIPLVLVVAMSLGTTEARADAWYADLPGARATALVLAVVDDDHEMTLEKVAMAGADVVLTCIGVAQMRAALGGVRIALRSYRSWGVQLLLRHVELVRASARWIAVQLPYWVTGKVVASWARRTGVYWMIEHARSGGRVVAEATEQAVATLVDAAAWVDDRARDAAGALAGAARWCGDRL